MINISRKPFQHLSWLHQLDNLSGRPNLYRTKLANGLWLFIGSRHLIFFNRQISNIVQINRTFTPGQMRQPVGPSLFQILCVGSFPLASSLAVIPFTRANIQAGRAGRRGSSAPSPVLHIKRARSRRSTQAAAAVPTHVQGQRTPAPPHPLVLSFLFPARCHDNPEKTPTKNKREVASELNGGRAQREGGLVLLGTSCCACITAVQTPGAVGMPASTMKERADRKYSSTTRSTVPL